MVASAFGLAAGWNLANIGAVASTMAASYDVSLATVGLLTTALFVTHTAIQVPGGRASDRFGAAWAGTTGMVAIVVGSLLALTVADPAVGILARAITGCGTGLAFVSGLALVRESAGSPFAQGVFGGIAVASGGLALAIVPQIAGGGWRVPYWTAIAWAAIALGLRFGLRVRSAAGGLPRRAEGLPPGVLRDGRLHRLALILSASYGLSLVLGNWVIELLERNSSVAGPAAATIGALTLLLGVVSRPLGGWIMRRYPDHIRRAIGASLLAGAVGTLGLLAGDSAVVVTVASVLVGVAAGIPFAPALTAAATVRPDAPAAAIGVLNSTANFLILVGTPLVGLTFALPGDGAIGFGAIALLWLAALAVLPRTAALAPARARAG